MWTIWTRKMLKENAMIVMNQNYWKSVIVTFALSACYGITSGIQTNFTSIIEIFTTIPLALSVFALSIYLSMFIAGFILIILVASPLQVGCFKFYMTARTAPGNMSMMGFAFKHEYFNVVKVQFFRTLYTFLWSLLLIVPGIIKMYEYRMMPYLLADNPSITCDEAFARSKAMMTGQKMNAFLLDLSFVGWHLLGALTFGILNFFYVLPWHQLAIAELYEVLRCNSTTSVDSSGQ